MSPPKNLAPDFQLKGLDGKIYTLSGFRGRPVLINFWATWCGPCRGEMPYLEEVYRDWKEKGLVFLAVNIGESASDVREFMDRYGLTMPVLMDTSRAVAGKYNITGIPTTYFIDSDGIIQNKVAGAFPNKASIEKYLGKLVN